MRAEQVSQLVLGETAAVLESRGDWRLLRGHTDGYGGWAHRGYLRELADADAARWAADAAGYSEGAEIDADGATARLPLRARVRLGAAGGAGDTKVGLPDGREGRVLRGSVRPLAEIVAGARRLPPEEWAALHFMGAPYQWGGVTPWGVDCSGLVQTTFAARGVALPRNSSQQIGAGAPVDAAAIRPGDLIFFRSESGTHINHVAFAAADHMLVHATLARGGVVREPWGPGTRAAVLRERLAGVRRIAP